MEQDGPSFYTFITTAGTVLTGAVAFLFKIVMKQSDEQVKISEKVGKLEGSQDGIKRLSGEVLDTVHKAIVERDKEKPVN